MADRGDVDAASCVSISSAFAPVAPMSAGFNVSFAPKSKILLSCQHSWSANFQYLPLLSTSVEKKCFWGALVVVFARDSPRPT